MKAIILAGGRGKRLRPVTDYVPKPLVPIANVPIIEWQIRYLGRFGITDVIISAGYMAGMIRSHLAMKDTGANITFSVEDEPLGTGGAIRMAASRMDESFLVMNGDVLTDIDIGRLEGRGNVIAAVELRTNFGVMNIDGNMVSGFREKGSIDGMWMNAGIYRLERDVVRDLPVRGDIERTLFPDYAAENKLAVEKFKDAWWSSVDSFKDMEVAADVMRRFGAG